MAMGPLPKIEIWIYFFIVICMYCNMAIDLYRLSLRVSYGQGKQSFLSPGWKYVDKLKDSAGYDWDSWIGYINQVWPWLCGHVTFGQLLYYIGVKPQVKQTILLLNDLIALIYCFAFRLIILVAGQSLAIFILACAFRSQLAVWFACIVLLISYNLPASADYIFFHIYGIHQNDNSMGLVFFFVTWSVLRYLSFGVELCRKRLSPSILDLFSYVFYLPLAVTGPIMSCTAFILQIKQPVIKPSLSLYFQLFFKLGRLVFWAITLEFSVHYFYLRSLAYQHQLIENCNNSFLCPWSLVLSCGIMLYVKYLVMYGIASAIARFDWLIPPQEPRCIARQGSYTEVWRYFDIGFYRFIVEYIYVPLGGSKTGIFRHLLSSLFAFTFIYIWHGLQFGIFLWTLNSFLSVSLETIGRLIVRFPGVHKFLDVHVTSQWQTRLYGILPAVLLVLGNITACMNLAINETVGMIFFQRIILNGWPWLFPASVATMYCTVQVSLFLSPS